MENETHATLESNPSRLAKCWAPLVTNAWLFFATATYLVTLFLVKDHPDWHPGLRVGVTLLPLLPGVVYLHKSWGTFKTLDELQRRIQLEAWSIAMAGTVIVSTTMNVLNANGIGFENYPHGLEIGGAYVTMFMLWGIGSGIANARFR
jgi:hypothetical protein